MARTREHTEAIVAFSLHEGDDFENAAYLFFARHFIDAQQVPAIPQGDGGIDFYTHGGTVGYCCYGPEAESRNTTAGRKELKTKIITKFKGDLKRIFELEENRSGKCNHRKNDGLESVLGQGRFKCIRLICNWFHDKGLLGPLNDAFKKYKAASQCRFVTDDCTLAFLGPEQIIDQHPPDDVAIFRLTRPGIMKLLDTVSATPLESLPPPHAEKMVDFEAKFEILGKIWQGRAKQVQRFKDDQMKRWRQCLLLLQKLESDHPQVHKEFERLLEAAAEIANEMSLSAAPDGNLGVIIIEKLTQMIRAEMTGLIQTNSAPDVARMMTARLIGECPFQWPEVKSDG